MPVCIGLCLSTPIYYLDSIVHIGHLDVLSSLDVHLLVILSVSILISKIARIIVHEQDLHIISTSVIILFGFWLLEQIKT